MSGQNYGYEDNTWEDNSYQNGAGYDGGETYQLQEQGDYDEGVDGVYEAQGPPTASQRDIMTSMFRSEEMALCQLFLQVMEKSIFMETILTNLSLNVELDREIMFQFCSSLRPLMHVCRNWESLDWCNSAI